MGGKKPEGKGKPDEKRERLFATNHKAGRDYELLETFEVGIALVGTEIKSIRQHRVSIDDSFARIDGGEVFLYNMHISPYEQGGRFNVEPLRVRKLLLHRREIDRLAGRMSRERLALVPLRLYAKQGLVKVALAMGRGRRVFEKRDRLKEREADRDIARRLRTDQKR
jgi:SsrA-binding protein